MRHRALRIYLPAIGIGLVVDQLVYWLLIVLLLGVRFWLLLPVGAGTGMLVGVVVGVLWAWWRV